MSGAYVVGINAIVIVCLGVFFAGDPRGYREGVLDLVPLGARARVREVMDEMGQMLRSWLLGQLVRSAWSRPSSGVALHLLGVPARALARRCRPAWRTSFPISGR